MEALEQDESGSACWSPSTTWLLADGSLEDSISFETSSSDATVDGVPSGVLLVRPAVSQPCEITVSFREKHEIHSVYVRSTARVYELYYSCDQNAISKEYLCTVRCGPCGASVKEMAENVSERAVADGVETNDVKEIVARSGSNSFEEDGWVEVKVPDSLLQDGRRFSSSNTHEADICPRTHIHYEATAQISDSSPCKSIILRLLSLQTISSVHVGEIYIYADPVLDTDPEPAVTNVGASSLLSMLAPGFLQISKSRLQDKSLCDVSSGSKESFSSERAIHASSPAKIMLEDPSLASSKKVVDPDQASKSNCDENIRAYGCVEDVLNVPISEHARDYPGDKQMRSADEGKGPYESYKPITEENNAPFMYLENILDDLVSSVGRIETFCSRFEEKMIKPLTCIDMRLQRLEEQLDAFTKIPQSTGTRISPPEFSVESDAETKDSISSSTVKDSCSEEKQATVEKLVFHLPESAKSSGLIIRAPEFPNEDESASSGGNSVNLTPDHPEDNKPLSLDGALASALAALLTSTTNISSVMQREYQNTDEDDIGSATYSVPVEDRNSSSFEFENAEKVSDEIYQDYQSCFNGSVDPEKNYLDQESKSRYIEKADGLSCNDSLSADDLSIEFKIHEPKSLIIKAPEFSNENNILDWGVNSDSHVKDYFIQNSHILRNPESTLTLASFLSSRNFVPRKCSPISHDEPSEPSSYSDQKSSLSDGVVSSRGESATKADSSLVRFFLSDSQSEKFDLHNHHNAAVLREDILKVAGRHESPVKTQADSSLVDLFLSLDLSEQPELENFHHTAILGEETSNSSLLHQANGSVIANKLLPGIELLAGVSAVDEESLGGQFNGGNAAVRGNLSDLLSTSDNFMESKLMDLTIENAGSSKTAPRRQTNILGLQQVSNLISDHDNFITDVQFCADKNLGSGLPLEILLGENSNDNLKDHNHDNDGDIETSQQRNSQEKHGLNQNCAAVNMTLIDMEDLTVQVEAEGVVCMEMNDLSQSTESASGNRRLRVIISNMSAWEMLCGKLLKLFKRVRVKKYA